MFLLNEDLFSLLVKVEFPDETLCDTFESFMSNKGTSYCVDGVQKRLDGLSAGSRNCKVLVPDYGDERNHSRWTSQDN